jgi:TatD DNase family protein
MKFIDTHSHLYLPQFDTDLEETVGRAQSVLEAVFLPNIDLESVDRMNGLRESWPDFFFPMMGLHPCSVEGDFEAVLLKIQNHLDSGTYFGIGETGIDLYWDKSWQSQQVEALEVQIGWAKSHGLPIILHSREALDITIGLMEKHSDDRLKGIFHCFDGTEAQAKRISEIPGFKMGIGGIVTYKKSTLPVVLKHLSPEDLVLETDSPYLPPVPFRGKRNESSYTTYVAEKLAGIYDMDTQTIGRITNKNAGEVFSKVFEGFEG